MKEPEILLLFDYPPTPEGSMGRREGHEGNGEGAKVEKNAQAYSRRPKERRNRPKNGSVESKCQLNEVTMGGKLVEDINTKEDFEAVTGSERGKERKKERVEIMIRVGGKQREMLIPEEGEEGAEFGKEELVEEAEKAEEREEGRICQDCRRKGMVASTEREEEAREEKKREKEESMMLNLNLPSTPTLVQANPPKWQTATSEEDWSLPEDRIVKNLRYSLEQLRDVFEEQALSKL